jgi:hypothetical protein
MEYCVARLMALNRKRHKAILVNLSSVSPPSSSSSASAERLYPLQSIATRLGFTHVPMQVVDRANPALVHATRQRVDTEWNTKWMALTGGGAATWRAAFIQHLTQQLERMVPDLCPSTTRTGKSYCT